MTYVSDCCGATVFGDTHLCSRCLKQCEAIRDNDEEYLETKNITTHGNEKEKRPKRRKKIRRLNRSTLSLFL